jgi:sterol desaturase/sphingolipid hydroxylase (fatty acid hydroxylase superfamily)
MQHFVPILWELHKVHHSATFLNPATTKRMHPLGDAFDDLFAAVVSSFPTGILAFIYHLSIIDLLAMYSVSNTIGTVIVMDPLRHSHFPISFGKLDYVLVSPHMHQVHHSYLLHHWDKNFGNKLSVWDWLFRTGVRPERGEFIELGLGTPENHDYESFYGVYLEPIVKIKQLFAEHWGARPRPPGRLGAGVISRIEKSSK